ncbi:MAG: flavin reductase family protein [Candidatus Thorarchaeota archaeon]
MQKIELDVGASPFPKPVVLIGSLIEGRPTFFTVAWFNRMSRNPNIWGAAVGKTRYTLQGIRENNNFSVNFPSADLVTETDYCGIRSGRDVDKSKIFNVFYGEFSSAPMIQDCPVTAECILNELIDVSTHYLLLGEVKHIYAESQYMTDGVLDQKKLNLLIFTNPANQYWTLGDVVADAYSVGKKLQE